MPPSANSRRGRPWTAFVASARGASWSVSWRGWRRRATPSSKAVSGLWSPRRPAGPSPTMATTSGRGDRCRCRPSTWPSSATASTRPQTLRIWLSTGARSVVRLSGSSGTRLRQETTSQGCHRQSPSRQGSPATASPVSAASSRPSTATRKRSGDPKRQPRATRWQGWPCRWLAAARRFSRRRRRRGRCSCSVSMTRTASLAAAS
mmetsp:Transcript_77977/g.252403  ORF Transcript_77977/g.252403 Transcript_77977/m.252403 type:complete len:205 (-) Transcript_77977:297-911(-)